MSTRLKAWMELRRIKTNQMNVPNLAQPISPLVLRLKAWMELRRIKTGHFFRISEEVEFECLDGIVKD